MKKSEVNPLKANRWVGAASAKVANVILFNAAWFAILLTQSSLLAPFIVILHLLIHFRLMGKGKPELLFIVGVTVVGLFLDQSLFATGVFNLAGEPSLAPLWLTCLWPVFATTLMHAFDWLQSRVILSSVVGGVGGCLSYIAGVRLTAIDFGSPLWGPIIIAALWVVIFPLYLKISGRILDASNNEPKVDSLGERRPS